MRFKFTTLIMAAVIFSLTFAATSCKKDTVKKIEVDNSFALSIFEDDSILMSDFLDMLDSTWRDSLFVVGEDGSLSVVVLNDTIHNVVAASKFLDSIEDVTIDVDNDVIVPGVTVPDSITWAIELLEDWPQGVPVPEFSFHFKFDTILNLGKVASFPFNVEDFSLQEVVIKTGQMAFDFDFDFDQLVTISAELWSDEIYYGTESFQISIANHTPTVNDLANYTMTPVDDSIRFNAIVQVHLAEETINQNTPLAHIMEIKNRVESVSGSHNLKMNGGITDLSMKSIEGTISVDLDRISEEIDGFEMDLNSLEGDLWLHTPFIKLGYVNTFGFKVNAVMDTMNYINNNDEEIGILATPLQLEITETAEGQFNYINVSDNLVESMEVLGGVKKIYFSAKPEIPAGTPCLITDDSHIDFATNIEMPLKMKVNQLTYTDSFPVSLGEDLKNVTNYLDEIELTFRAKNGLPLAIGMQLYTCDSTLTQTGEFITDSIFKADEYGVMHNTIMSNFGEGGTANSTVILSIKNDKTIENLLNANKLMMRLTLTTNGEMVSIKTTDLLGLGIGLKTKTTEINL